MHTGFPHMLPYDRRWKKACKKGFRHGSPEVCGLREEQTFSFFWGAGKQMLQKSVDCLFFQFSAQLFPVCFGCLIFACTILNDPGICPVPDRSSDHNTYHPDLRKYLPESDQHYRMDNAIPYWIHLSDRQDI